MCSGTTKRFKLLQLRCHPLASVKMDNACLKYHSDFIHHWHITSLQITTFVCSLYYNFFIILSPLFLATVSIPIRFEPRIHPPVEWELKQRLSLEKRRSQSGTCLVCLSEFRIKRKESDWLFRKEAELNKKLKSKSKNHFLSCVFRFYLYLFTVQVIPVATETDRDRDCKFVSVLSNPLAHFSHPASNIYFGWQPQPVDLNFEAKYWSTGYERSWGCMPLCAQMEDFREFVAKELQELDLPHFAIINMDEVPMSFDIPATRSVDEVGVKTVKVATTGLSEPLSRLKLCARGMGKLDGEWSTFVHPSRQPTMGNVCRSLQVDHYSLE